jgi:ADP-ribosyl-[dinitrogen reductase] hydrolase
MNNAGIISPRERVLGGLWGSLVGDALGVPVEFKNRATVQADPVTDMRGFGTHHQPPGTWSDDSSLLLCSVDSLLRHEFDAQDMGHRFLSWYREELWTPHGKVFDVGVTTSEALARIAAGVPGEVAGADSQFSNGNGSLMRIIPVSLRFAHLPVKQLLDRTHRASSITHRHPRSQIACGLYSLVVQQLSAGRGVEDGIEQALAGFHSFYDSDPYWAAELDYFRVLLAGDLGKRPESEIDSSGYVVHTLTASLWCLLTTRSYEECVLKAVNLGGDTDTTGCVAGGLAGVHYGRSAIPEPWRQAMARHDEVEGLFDRFADTLATGHG